MFDNPSSLLSLREKRRFLIRKIREFGGDLNVLDNVLHLNLFMTIFLMEETVKMIVILFFFNIFLVIFFYVEPGDG